jgi:hypothetical protein
MERFLRRQDGDSPGERRETAAAVGRVREMGRGVFRNRRSMV